MIGRPLQLAFPDRDSDRGPSEICLEVAGLEGERFGPIDLTVHRGEVLGIAGAEGNGQVPVPPRPRRGGSIRPGRRGATAPSLDGRSPVGPLRAGVVYLSGDRIRESLFPVLSVRANTTIQVLRALQPGRHAQPPA